jgi:5-(carboxyamino)imidazole ribonucleotide synthase
LEFDSKTHSTVGIVGAGQLGFYLGQALLKAGHQVRIWGGDATDPATHLGPAQNFTFFCAPMSDFEQFLNGLDALTFESEFFDDALLKEAEAKSTQIWPPAPALKLLRNKLQQKNLFKKLGMPTADFKVYQAPQTLTDWLTDLCKSQSFWVLKKSLGGYDGHGNFFLKDPSDIRQAEDFCQKSLDSGAEIYAEQGVDFRLELALVGSRNKAGDSIFWPLTVTEQQQGTCLWCYGPAENFFEAIEPIKTQGHQLHRRLSQELSYVGTLAIEFFLNQQGQLLINEVAPRVHNSAHFSLDACSVTQFDGHIEALLNQTLTEPKLKAPYFAMKNLLGPANFSVKSPLPKSLANSLANSLTESFQTGAHLHWYQKAASRSRRKLGHVNLTFEFLPNLHQIKTLCESWEAKFWTKLTL